MLTPEEFKAASAATWFWSSWGCFKEASPDAAVALLRGQKFAVGKLGYWTVGPHGREIADQALRDLSQHLGFADVQDYFKMLREKKRLTTFKEWIKGKNPRRKKNQDKSNLTRWL
jgi:hypothetical protein